MKKIMFMIICLISFIGISNAVGIEKKVETEVLYSSNTNILEYKDGYLFINTGSGFVGKFGTLLTYFKNNKKVSSKEINNITLESVAVDNDYIYVYGYKSIDQPSYYNSIYFLKLDKDFNVVDEKDARQFESTYHLSNYLHAYKAIIKDNKFVVLLRHTENSTEYAMVVTKDFNIESIEPLSSSPYKNDFPNLKRITYGDNYITYEDKSIECYEDLANTNQKPKVAFLADGNPNCSKQVVSLVDKNDKVIWEKDFKNYGVVHSVGTNAFHILIATDKALLVVNKKGEIEAELNKIKVDGELFVAGDYLIFTNRETEGELCTAGLYDTYTKCADAVRHSIYKLIYNIKSKVLEGKGKVEVVESSEATEGVTFKVIPDEGYALGVVKVTDVNGAVLTFTDYTFTMPSADVLIEVTFVKAKTNPKTADIAVIAVAVIAFITVIITLIQYRKTNLIK